MKRQLQTFIIIGSIALGLLFSSSYFLAMLANSSRSSRPKPIVYIPPDLDLRGTPSGPREGAAGRGDCPKLRPPLTALVPQPNWGLTVAEHPAFWFYIPSADCPDIAEKITFVLTDRKTQKEIYQESFQPKKKHGIMAISLPETVSPLELDEQYDWQLSYICTPLGKSPEQIYLKGSVMRVKLPTNLNSQLEATTIERERIVIYAENGFWQDALTRLVQLYQSQPGDEKIKADWVNLLRSVDLESLAWLKIER